MPRGVWVRFPSPAQRRAAKDLLVTNLAALLLLFWRLVLGSLPVENKIEGNNLVVKFVIGKKMIDISDAVVMPIPEELNLK